MKTLVPNVKIVGSEKDSVLAMNYPVKDGDVIKTGSLEINVFETPCHTKGHLCFVVSGSNKEESCLFCGDTLFVGGVGKFFEGNGELMATSLQKLMSLPKSTKIFPGHEYTLKNLMFGNRVEPNNKDLESKFKWAQSCRENKLPTIPSTIEEELKTNVFLRYNEENIKKLTKETKPGSVLQVLRKMKNEFDKAPSTTKYY
jgi:hydroxyacylglutathione hydrolase